MSTDLIGPTKHPSEIRNNVQLWRDLYLFLGTISRNGTLIAPTCENTLIVPTSTTTTTTMAVCQLYILEAIELVTTTPNNTNLLLLFQIELKHLVEVNVIFLNSIFLRKIHYFDPNMTPPNSKGNSRLVDYNLILFITTFSEKEYTLSVSITPVEI